MRLNLINFNSLYSLLFHSKKLERSDQLKVARDLDNFYRMTPRFASLSDYYDKYKGSSEIQENCDQKIYDNITEEIRFYSEVARDPEMKEICDGHLTLLEALQTVARLKLTKRWEIAPIALCTLSMTLVGTCTIMGLGMMGLAANAPVNYFCNGTTRVMDMTLSHILNATSFVGCVAFLGLFLTTSGWYLSKTILSDFYTRPQKYQKHADWALAQSDLVRLKRFRYVLDREFIPGSSSIHYYVDHTQIGYTPAAAAGSHINDTCKKTQKLVREYLTLFSQDEEAA